jgi:hypothetical protein
MRAITKLLAASAVALTMSAAAASANAAVYIAIDNGGGVTQVFSQATDGVFSYSADCGVIGCGGYESVIVGGFTGIDPTLLHSFEVDVNNSNTGSANLTVYFTRTDIVGPMPSFGYLSNFTSNNSNTSFNTTLSTYADASNGKFGGTLLGTFNTSLSGAVSTNVFSGGLGAGSGPFSVTEKYVITESGNSGGSSSPTIILSAAVPEPATWALMIMGFGSAGALLRSQRRRHALAA